MITGIEFNKLSKEKIEMHELTKNTIVLFNNCDLKNKFIKEFSKLQFEDDGKDDIIYCTIEDDKKAEDQDHKADIRTLVTYMPTSIYLVDNEQRFVFTTEAPFVLQCKDSYDLWFCDTDNEGEIQVWSFIDFTGYKEMWNNGIVSVYKDFCCGKFGCYEGYGR